SLGMGSCISSDCGSNHEKPLNLLTTKLILMDGSIQEFSKPVKCQEILSKYSGGGHFICSSAGLYTGEHISEVLHEDDLLRAGELYFLLPNRRLNFVLTDLDMASMLLKANGAIEKRRKCKGKVQPLFDMHLHEEEEEEEEEEDSAPLPLCCMSKIASAASNSRKQRRQSKLETILEGS
ncbi:hypothetical protein KI387_025375, partial [Taxus chinensis]